MLDRFLSYVRIDSSSDPYSNSSPSSASQKELSRKLVMDLYDVGMQNVTVDINGYIMATLPANSKRRVPTIGFLANYDTTPEIPSIGNNYRVVDEYDGTDIVLQEGDEDHPPRLLSPLEFPELRQYSQQTLITSDGKSILGADGKAGIAEIITAMELLKNQDKIKHGPIRIAFAPDEQIGRGALNFDIETFGAEWAYSLQASGVGELQFESFNGAEARIRIKGRKSHSGFARGQMINASRLAFEYLQLLPADDIPELTSGNQGFFHLTEISGDVSEARINLQVRDHIDGQFVARKKLLRHFVDRMNEEFPQSFEIEIEDLFHNMVNKIKPHHNHIIEVAALSMVALGIKPLARPIRGGNLAVHLSQQGLPCVSIFTGGHNFHGPFEYISADSMVKSVQFLVKMASEIERKFRRN